MSRKNRALLFSISSFLSVLIVTGCGSGVQTTTPNPSGFNNASLSGTFVFSISGNNGGGFFTVAGSLTADGNGNITGGTEDINSPGTGLVVQNVAISGSYNIRTDGRGVATINTTSLNPAVSFGLDFVLLDTSKGLLIRFDQNGTASGSLDLQNSSAANLTTLAGSFVFNVAGIDSATTQGSESSAGLVTFDASGNITAGLLDDNDSGTVNGSASFGAAAASITATAAAISSPTNGRGTATITTSGSLAVTRHFVYYVIDANHLKLIETDAAPILSGDAFRQSSTPVSGSFAFTLAGATATGHGIFIGGGILNTDGAGNILNTSIEDLDNGGAFTVAGGVPVTGTYTVTGGRGTMQLSNGTTTLNLVFYPSTIGLQLLDVDASAIEASGAALPQTGAPFSNASVNNGYGLNFSGVVGPGTVSQSEIDAISQFNANGNGTITGAMDVNNFGSTNSSLALNGSYTVSPNGRGTASLKTSQETINLVFYMSNNSQIQFIELDEGFGQLSVGTFASQ